MRFSKNNLLLVIAVLFMFACANKSDRGNELKPSNIQKALLEIQYSDNTVTRINLSEGAIQKEYADSFTKCSVELNNIGFGDEIQLSLTCINPKPLKYVDLVFVYDNDFKGDDLIYFNNGLTTNADVGMRITTPHGVTSRELILFKNQSTNKFFNLGFGSFKRFLTYFKTDKEKVIARTCMENKELKTGEEYNLEPLIIDDKHEGDDFFRKYALLLGERYKVKLKDVPSGWSSWSAYYGRVKEKDVLKDSRIMAEKYKRYGANIMQLDAGWFHVWGDWGTNSKFPNGMDAISKDVRNMGLRFGNWYAPTLMKGNSKLFKENFDFNVFYNGKPKRSFGGDNEELIADPAAAYPLDLSNEKAMKFMGDLFRKAVQEDSASYFKLDFLVRSLIRGGGNGEDIIFYPGDYCVAQYNKAMNMIRDIVGDDTYLMACGAPIGESIGVFDGIRVGTDILRGSHPPKGDHWGVIKRNIYNTFLRSYFHRTVFNNDPDGLIVRGYPLSKGHAVLSDEEAKTWATAVAMSGGAVLINERMDEITPERENLFKELLPVYGKNAVPLDYFELPGPSIVHYTVDESKISSSMVAVFNHSGEIADKTIPLDKIGYKDDVIAIDCWEKEIVGIFKGSVQLPEMSINSSKAMLVKERPEVPCFLFADANFYLGIDRCDETFSGNKLSIKMNKSVIETDENIYIYVPVEFSIKGCTNWIFSDTQSGNIRTVNL